MAAARGHDESQQWLGDIYREGSDAPQDFQEALEWYRLAAMQGNTDAKNDLGQMYRDGQGTLKDFRQAIHWFRLSAEQGDYIGQMKLGEMHRDGHGTLQDKVSAHMWFNIAAALESFGLAKSQREILEKNMTLEQIGEAQKLAHECVAKEYRGC